MNHEPPGQSPTRSLPSNLLAELRSQCERLQEVVRGLEEEKARDAQALAETRAELSEYQRLLRNWAQQQVREEDWQDFSEAEYTITAEEAIAELERQDAS